MEFLELAMTNGWPEERLGDLARQNLKLGPKAAAKLVAEVVERGASGRERTRARFALRDLEQVQATLDKLWRYPAGTVRGGNDVGGQEILDPKDLDVPAICRCIDLRGKILGRQRGAASSEGGGAGRLIDQSNPRGRPSLADPAPGPDAKALLGDDELGEEDEEASDGD